MGCLVDRTPPPVESYTDEVAESEVKTQKITLMFTRKQTVEKTLPKPKVVISGHKLTADDKETLYESLCSSPGQVFVMSDSDVLKCLQVLMEKIGLLKFLSRPIESTTEFIEAYSTLHRPNKFSSLQNSLAVCIAYCYIYKQYKSVWDKYLSEAGLCTGFLSCMAINNCHPGVTEDFLAASQDPLYIRYGGTNILPRHASAEFCQLLINFRMVDSLNRSDRRSVLNSICTHLIDSTDHIAVSKAKALHEKNRKLTNQPNDCEFLVSYLVLASRMNLYLSFDVSQEWFTRIRKELADQHVKETQLEITQTAPFNEELFLKTTVHPVYEALSEFNSAFKPLLNSVDQVINEWCNLLRFKQKKLSLK